MNTLHNIFVRHLYEWCYQVLRRCPRPISTYICNFDRWMWRTFGDMSWLEQMPLSEERNNYE